MTFNNSLKSRTVLIILLFLSTVVFAQYPPVDQCGLDDHANLNAYESAYLNAVFEARRDTFDFTNKNVAYVYGSGLENFQGKSDYFENFKRDSISNDNHSRDANHTQIMILTSEEKELSGGYDVILILWAKFLVEEKRRARMVKNLGRVN